MYIPSPIRIEMVRNTCSSFTISCINHIVHAQACCAIWQHYTWHAVRYGSITLV
jgi:hypothetical protein